MRNGRSARRPSAPGRGSTVRAEEVSEVEPGGALAAGDVPGADGFRGAGAGASLTYDTRDGPFWPSRGAFAQAWYTRYPSALGDHGGLGRGLVEARKFVPLGAGRVLGLAGIGEWSHGDVPFTMLPRLGSTRYLRGIREGRYRDRLAVAGQAELRLPVRGRLSATAFGALGEVAPSPRDLGLEHDQGGRRGGPALAAHRRGREHPARPRRGAGRPRAVRARARGF